LSSIAIWGKNWIIALVFSQKWVIKTLTPLVTLIAKHFEGREYKHRNRNFARFLPSANPREETQHQEQLLNCDHQDGERHFFCFVMHFIRLQLVSGNWQVNVFFLSLRRPKYIFEG
jgi:hypothetical protein